MKNIKVEQQNTLIGRAIEIDAIFSNPFVRAMVFLVWAVGLFSFAIILDQFFLHQFSHSDFSFGFSVIMAAVFLFYLADRSYYFSKVKRPRIHKLDEFRNEIKKKAGINLFEVFSFGLAKALSSLTEKKEISTKELALALVESSDMNFLLMRLGIGKADLSKNIKSYVGTTNAEDILLRSLDVAILEDHHHIEVGDVFVSLCEKDLFFTKLLQTFKLETQDIANVVYWQTHLIRSIYKDRKFLNPARLKMTGGIGRDWAFGWTPYLKQFSVDITSQVEERGMELEIIGHDKELGEIKEALLRQNGGNAIVVGDAGVGKNTTVLGFAKRVSEGQTFSPLDYRHIIKIDVDYLIAGLTHPGEMTQRITGVLGEVQAAGNIIVFIENFQNLLSSGDAGKIDATEVLLPFLESPEIHVIATCDVANFHQYIANNSNLSQRFTRINIDEPDKKEMVRILESVVPSIENKTKSIITYESLKEVINAADKYILNLPNPEKSINLLDSVAMHAISERGKTVILPKDVLDYISVKYDIPTGEASEVEKEKLLSLENVMHKNVIGQNEAINAISNAMRRSRAGVESSKKPIGSFLFLGPTGVGKTETAKALAEAYFGSKDRMIRFDMSEYQSRDDINRLIGSSEGGEVEQGLLTTAVRENPFSLILFDEIEKANKGILDLFLQMLDEGFISDALGRKVSFANSIIISTSNAGSDLIRESIQSGAQYELLKKDLLNYLQAQGIYRPEFLNRFSAVIAFSPLSEKEIEQVAMLMLNELSTNLQREKGISVTVTPETVKLLAKSGYDPQMGARPMSRVIQEKVENFLATKILSGEIKKGDSISIGPKDIQ